MLRALLPVSFALLLAGLPPAQHRLEVTGVPDEAPFTVEAWADAARLVVDLHLRDGWHAYARDVGGGEPVSLTLDEKGEVAAVGTPRLPPDEMGKLYGRVRIEQWIRAKGGDEIAAAVNFMVCDPSQCLPPIELQVRGKVTPLRVLLVTSGDAALAGRIGELLTGRGMQVTTTTYDAVDGKACDAHDLVFAASKLFREDGKGGQKSSSFPKTTTPIVATGFLGTKLVKGHGVAMTSGYI